MTKEPSPTTSPSKVTVSGSKQALINLVGNAIKYNRPGGGVEIKVADDGNNAIIGVIDTGLGIAPGDLSRIFERFYRVDKSRSRERGGSGLGLPITKKIVEDHGGSISVESTPGQGSVFRIKLPMAKYSSGGE